ncbi:MAG: 2-hydroxyacyl-CoA dehydratase family protein [Chloroflexota bacterium]|nr:2-hydroxyacyl-CoA dehydratase family protein [Chloroflexota bacterium]
MYRGEGKFKTSARHWTETTKKVRGMLKDQYAGAHTTDKPVVWSMLAMINELYMAMDVYPLYPENYAGLCATKRVADPFLERAQADGFSDVCCTYAQTGLGYAAMCQDIGQIPDFAPDGGMAKPMMLVGSSLVCDTRFKWFQSFARYLDVPYYAFDMPIPRSMRPDTAMGYLNYTVEQMRGLVEFMERVLGKKMNWDKLDEIVTRTQKTYECWYEAFITSASAIPCPMPAEDTLTNFAPAFFMTGSEEALNFYQELLEEVKGKIERKEGVVPEEKYRLIWGSGLPPWHTMNVFNSVEERGAVFVYQCAYQPFAPMEIPGITDPLMRMLLGRGLPASRRLAREMPTEEFSLVDMSSPAFFIEPFKADGIVISMLRSCRGTSIGQTYLKRKIQEQAKVPVLILETDICDVHAHSEANVAARFDAFFETLESRKKAGAS